MPSTHTPRTRVFALSDIHIDYQDNMTWIQDLSATEYQHDVLLLAGDVSDDLSKLQVVFMTLCAKFAQVFFVPGNHELWVRRQECPDSLAKFWRVLELCHALGVQTSPGKIGSAPGTPGIWVVPLFSWYVQPEEGSDSLFVHKEGEDPTLEMWADNYFTRWPAQQQELNVAETFLRLNEAHVYRSYDAPVISFSHFMPRAELMYRTPYETTATGVVPRDRHPRFNFSRVAGCGGLEAQIRQLGSTIHVYGHQHRNRHRWIDGVLYVSHCLGYPAERARGEVQHIDNVPKILWDSAESNRENKW